MQPNRIVGIVILVVGVVLLGFGYNSTTAPVDQLTETITGRYSDTTMWYFGVGIAGVIGGGLLAAFGSKR